MGVGEFLGPGPDAGSKEQLAAGRRPQAAGRAAGAALVGDLEDADLLDRVAEELDPQRVLLGRREHVEQSAADRQLAALGDHLRARVADVDQPRDHVVLIGLVSFAQPDRLQVAEPGHDRLQHAPHRRDDDLERATVGRMSQAAQHRDPLAHRVRARRQPLVRQRLPAGEAGDGIRRQECAKRGRQVLGLPRGRGHGEHEPAGAVPAGAGAPPPTPAASAATISGRSAGGATRSRSPPGRSGGLASAVESWGSSATAASSPARLIMSQSRR